MPRKLRIEFAGAIYHVRNRGDRREPIFRDDRDRNCFLETLGPAGGVGGLLAITDASQGSHFCAYDENGNVTALVKADGAGLTAQYAYGPFGELLRATGPMAKVNPFRFSTKYQDDETDLLYYGYRYYNASTGRWLSRGPLCEPGFETLRRNWSSVLGGVPNPYLFVRNNPVARFDALGLKDVEKENPQDCWETPEDFYCGDSHGVAKWCCEKALGALFKSPGARKRACQVQKSKCDLCCSLSFEEDEAIKAVCIVNCAAKQALCLIGARK